jgi:hypothetical protein
MNLLSAPRLSPGLSALALAAALAAPAQAGPIDLNAFTSGSGNVSVFDAAAGTGGWVGSLEGFADPFTAAPLSLVSVVLFTLDNATDTFTGTFEFTTTDLMSSFFGTLSGDADDDVLLNGGQFRIDYQVLGGTGVFSAATGFGLGLLDFDLAGTPDNYREAGVFAMQVPEPATWALVALGLMAIPGLGAGRRRRAESIAP